MTLTRSEFKLILISVAACILTAVIVLQIVKGAEKKIAVVDAVRLFNEYKMKQELEGRAEGRLRYLGKQVDSLKREVAAGEKNPSLGRADIEHLYGEAHKAQIRLEQEYQQSNQLINEQVWKRLNPLVDEYGKKHALRLIVGANGMGSVLYNDDYYDHTKALIDFVNSKYEGN